MKKILFASTAAAAMTAGGMAAAQETGVTVFGDARLGLGFNVLRAGGALTDDDELRAISRVRFGVRLTGETTTGITFGGTIRADNAIGGGSGALGGTAGNVFVSGAFGTLTFGDTASAHHQHAGDLPGVGLSALGDFNEPRYLGNRVGGAGNRPTVRYDIDIAGFGVSASTNGELDEVGIGASFSPQLGGGTVTIGGGYYDGDGNNQWAAAIGGGFMGFTGKVIYTNADNVIAPEDSTETLGIGIGTTVQDIGLNAFYREGFGDGADIFDGNNAYGVGFTYNLGGGASLRGGVVNTWDNDFAADLGIQLAF